MAASISNESSMRLGVLSSTKPDGHGAPEHRDDDDGDDDLRGVHVVLSLFEQVRVPQPVGKYAATTRRVGPFRA
jgi:hypothetical protein